MRVLRAKSAGSWTAGALLCAVVLLLGATAWAGGLGRGERHESRREIDLLEDSWRQAIISRNVARVDNLLADDYMGITATGMLQSKDETLAHLRSGNTRFTSMDVSDRKVRFYGTTAVVISKVEIAGNGPEGDVNGAYRYTHVYVRDEKGVWKIVSFEASRIREPHEHK